jgi:hypothetical protein
MSLAAALVPLGTLGMPNRAEAVAALPYSSHVEGSASDIGGGVFDYQFTVYNDTLIGGEGSGGFGGDYMIVDWELPIFDLDAVSNVLSPVDWWYEIVTPAGVIAQTSNANDSEGALSRYFNTAGGPYDLYGWTWTKEADPVWQADNAVYGPNPDAFLTPTYILHWYTGDSDLEGGPAASPLNPIDEGDSLGGFSFKSLYGSANAPYMASWYQEPPTIGDPPSPTNPPQFFPNSPNAPSFVPAPAALPGALLVMAGMAGFAVLRRRRVENA